MLKKKNKTGLIVLIDPDKIDKLTLSNQIKIYENCGVDTFFIGSSQPIKNNISEISKIIKDNSTLPLIVFPGSPNQLTPVADAVLFISLISGRNPDYLIENHVASAPYIKKIGLKTIPTGYILIDGGYKTSVEKVSKTSPLQADNIDKIVAHALAGEMLGMKYIYLEAGSGAKNYVPIEVIKAVKKNISIPLIVGGGIKRPQDAKEIANAGADFIVVGNKFEESNNRSLIENFVEAIN